MEVIIILAPILLRSIFPLIPMETTNATGLVKVADNIKKQMTVTFVSFEISDRLVCKPYRIF